MLNYTVSKKIAIIEDINRDSEQLYSMLESRADLYNKKQIKQLFINIIAKDENNVSRFSFDDAKSYFHDLVIDESTNRMLLISCVNGTNKAALSHFLFI